MYPVASDDIAAFKVGRCRLTLSNPRRKRLEAPRVNLLTLKCDELLSTFAFTFNLRRYSKCDELIEAMEDLRNKLVPTFAIKVGCCQQNSPPLTFPKTNPNNPYTIPIPPERPLYPLNTPLIPPTLPVHTNYTPPNRPPKNAAAESHALDALVARRTRDTRSEDFSRGE